MRRISQTRALILLVIGLSLPAGLAEGAEQVSDLAELSQADRIAVMKAFLERRIDKVQNIDVVSETRIYNREYSNGILGRRVAESGWYDFETKHCNGSYGVTSSWFISQDATVADSTAKSHFDEKTGITRILSQQVNRPGYDGRIGLEHLPSMHSNRVPLHLLGGSFVMQPALDKCDFLLQSLVACSDQWHVDLSAQGQQIVISHPFRIAFVDTGTGTRKVYFDAAKGMLPVRIDIDWSGEVITSLNPRRLETIWREERIVMDEAKEFGGCWMAMRIEERVRTQMKPAECSIYLTNVKRITFGEVKESDLEVTFPPGTTVADTVKNVFYQTGADGEPSGPINPIGVPDGPITLDEKGELVPKSSWLLPAGLWSLGIALILFLCLLGLRRLRLKSAH